MITLLSGYLPIASSCFSTDRNWKVQSTLNSIERPGTKVSLRTDRTIRNKTIGIRVYVTENQVIFSRGFCVCFS